jgi:hypothetical protein
MPTPITFGLVPPPSHDMGAPLGGKRYVIFGSKTSVASKPEPTPAPRLSANKRRKAAPIVLEPSSELMSMAMQPLNVTIVARCVLARSQPPSPPSGSTKKRAGRDTPAASPTPSNGPPVHPYSRHYDLANTRSTVPSPFEIARAERQEEEKARQKKENAAAARAAAALARRRRALRSGGRGTPRAPSAAAAAAPNNSAPMIPPIQRAVAAQRAKSAEAAAAELHASEAVTASIVEPEDAGAVSLPHRALKRTRSSGLINVVNGNGTAVGSPLRTVTTHSDEDDEDETAEGDDKLPANGEKPVRKRSRLAESTLSPRPRRAASASPVGASAALPYTSPRKNGTAAAGAPDASPDSTAMRRVVSAQDPASLRRTTRNGSVTPEGRERSRREVQLPARYT